MCCRFYTDDTTKKDILRLVGSYDQKINWLREGDVRPGDTATVITAGENALYASDMSWGKIFNARSETVKTKPFFAESYQKRRCVIPVKHFYEWDPEKNKVELTVEGERSVYLAGIYTTAVPHTADGAPFLTTDDAASHITAGGPSLLTESATSHITAGSPSLSTESGAAALREEKAAASCAEEAAVMEFSVLTTAPGDSMKPVHDRQPLILREEEIKDWIFSASKADQILQKSPVELMLYREFEQLSLSAFFNT